MDTYEEPRLPIRDVEPPDEPDEEDVPIARYSLGINLWLDVDMSDRGVDAKAFAADWDDLETTIKRVLKEHADIVAVTECELLETETA